MAYYEKDVWVGRGNGIRKIRSGEVVPGDVVFVKDNGVKFMFDGVIVDGEGLVD